MSHLAAVVGTLPTHRYQQHAVTQANGLMTTSVYDVAGRLVAVRPSAAGQADLGAIRYYGVAEGDVAGVHAQVARTGYTGEDGFEVFAEAPHAADVWRALSAAGQPDGVLPAGLACRDTLRLEAGMPLYGNELTAAVTPFDAGLGRVVKFDKTADFVGRAALERRRDAGTPP